MSVKDASCEELLNNMMQINDSITHAEWIIDRVNILDEVEAGRFMDRMDFIKHHLQEYWMKQKEEYSRLKFGNPIAKHAPAKIYLLKK